MFQPFDEGWPAPPPPDPPEPTPKLDAQGERHLVIALCLFLLALFLSPIAGGTLFDAVGALLAH